MKRIIELVNGLQAKPNVQAFLQKTQVFIQGEFPRGERLPKKPKSRMVIAVEKPPFNDWCLELGVSAKFNKNKPTYYEL